MKVFLFVQTGDARPKVAWVGASARRVAACYQRDAFRNHMARDKRSVDFIPRWWLVECANAEAGRATIVMGDDGGPWGGRILASGGRHA